MMFKLRSWSSILLTCVILASALSISTYAGPIADTTAARSLAPHSNSDYVAAPLDTPEKLATGYPFSVALGGGYLVWTELPGEFCSPEGAVKAVNLTTRAVRTLRSGCDISPASVVADDTHVYYAERQSDTIQRIPIGGGASSTVANAHGLIHHRGLLLDDTHAYFEDEQGINRVHKAGGAVEILAAGHDSGGLALDETYLYWPERGILITDHAIRRVPKTGGTVETILSGSSLENPGGIAVDETYVYFGDSGSIKRMPKAGGSVSILVPAEPLYGVGNLALNSTHLYWTDSTGSSDGRLRRVPKGGGTVENLALGLLGPRGVNLSATHVYWGTYGGIWRLPLDAGAVAVDLTISALEITQAIQNLDNDVPLVQEKTTYVRVYPAVDIADTPNVQAVLHGTRGGVALPESPLIPVVPRVHVRQSGNNRDFLSHSFNFWLPLEWCSGTVTLRAEINPSDTIPETDSDNNSFTLTRTFNPKKPLCVDMHRVRTEPTTASVYDPGFWDIVEWLKAAYPVPDVWIYRGDTIEELEVCWAFILPYPCGGPYEMPDDSSKVLTSLWWEDLFTDDPDECGDAYYYGMVHQSHLYQGGAGVNPGWWAWGAMNVDPNYLGGRWPWYVPHGGSTLAHELGHNEGRDHVNCGGPDDPDPGYPYNNCDLGPDDPTAYYGFDVLDVAVIPPTTAGDLMSYATNVGKPRWPSDYTYRALYGALPSAAASSWVASTTLVQEAVQAEETLAVTGIITPTEGTAALDYAYRLPKGLVSADGLVKAASRILTSSQAAYSLRLLDKDNGILGEQSFDLPDEGDPVGDMRSFHVLMPYEPATAFIVLSQKDTELARQPVSESPPSVQVLSPNGGENISGSMTIHWTANDPDNDALLYTVQYSPNDGDEWRTLATGYYTRALVLDDLSTVPGSNAALIRVIATDGVNTASDTSDQIFQVAMNPPDVHISQPTDGAVFTSDTQVILIGSAFDVEDGPLFGTALQWSVDGQLSGFGQELALSGLEPGLHLITLEAEDSNNDKAIDSVSILIGDERIYLPLILRNQ